MKPMKKASPPVFLKHVVDSLREFGPVQTKAMFGCWGLYHQGLFFALVAGDALYLKTDAENLAEFQARGLEAFVYRMKGGDRIVMSYYEAPEEALESPAVMAEWARSAFGAALRKATSMKRQQKV
jgi:DNA transformation protein